MEENNNNLNAKEKSVKVKNKKTTTIVVAVIILVVTLSANVFASTQGYGNIFFLIKELIQGESEITDRDQILSDKDITISYQPIEIVDGLEIQINRLVVKDNEATLIVNVKEEKELKKCPKEFVVYDVTNERTLLGQQKLTRNTAENGRYEEKIILSNYAENTKTLQLEINDENEENMIILEIKLDKKEIDVVSKSSINEFQKISEVELKDFLANVVRINYYKDSGKDRFFSEPNYKNNMRVIIALETLNKTKAKEEEVHKVLKEITGEEITEPLEVTKTDIKYSDGYYYYGDTTADIIAEDPVKALCLSTSNLKYSKGKYSVNCVYVHTRNADYENNKIEELPKFETHIEFKINKEYEYSKFCMLNSNDITSTPYENIKEDEENTTPVLPKDESNTVASNTVDNNTVSNNTVSNNTVSILPENNNENKLPEENTSPVLPNDGSNSESVNLENIDNYASTMLWNDFFTPGLRGIMPADWEVTVYDDIYSGNNEDGKLAKTVKGVARGINKETNEIITSNVTINFYMPEFIKVENTFDYTKIIANRYNMEASEAGFTSHEGMDWKMVVAPNSEREFYCHFEPLAGGEDGIGYVVEIVCDNYENYKVINIINWIFGNLKGASF